MNAIKATWRDGRIIPLDPVDWPDGTELLVEPVPDGQTIGIREEDWPTTPEAIEEWLRWYDSLEPLIFTPEEEAALEADRQARKEYEKAIFFEHAEKLRKMWE
jgi:hypothetical protein